MVEEFNIKSLEQIINKAYHCIKPHHNKWKKIEERIVEEKKENSLPLYLVLEYHINKKTLKEIGDGLGVDATTIKNLMGKLGIPTRKLKDSKNLGSKNASEIIEFYKQEIRKIQGDPLYVPISRSQVAKIFNVSAPAVCYQVNNNLSGEELEILNSRSLKGTKRKMYDNLNYSKRKEILGFINGMLDEFRFNKNYDVLFLTELAEIFGVKKAGLKTFVDNYLSKDERELLSEAWQERTKRNLNDVSDEVKSHRASYGGIACFEKGTGIHALSSRELSRNGIKGGNKCYRDRIGIHGANDKEKEEWLKKAGREAVKANIKKAYNVEKRFYTQSMQEGAVALLLENYLDNFRVKEGSNFQIRRGVNSGGIDFLINNEFLEWHPILLYNGGRGDIPNEEGSNSYQKVLKYLPKNQRANFEEDYKKVLAVNYRNSRQNSIDNSGYAGKSLTLVTNVKELYDFISKYSDKLPNYNDFNREFNQKVKYVKSFKVQAKPKPKSKDKQLVEAA